MEIKLAEKLVESIRNNGSEAKIREKYSARYMYEMETAAVVTDSMNTILKAVIENAQMFVDFEYINEIRSDNMGLDMVFY